MTVLDRTRSGRTLDISPRGPRCHIHHPFAVSLLFLFRDHHQRGELSLCFARTQRPRRGLRGFQLGAFIFLHDRRRASSPTKEAFNLIAVCARGFSLGVSEFGMALLGSALGGHPPGGLARAVLDTYRMCVVWWVCSRRGPQPGPKSKRIKPAAALSSSHSSPVAFQQLTQQGEAPLQQCERVVVC